MNFKMIVKALGLIVVVTLLNVSCIRTLTNIKNPMFSKTIDSLQLDLNKLVTCETINLNGKETDTDGKITSELTVNIINGHDIPDDEHQMNSLAKQIAMVLKESLQKGVDFQTYNVLFVTKKESAGVTRNSWKGKVFQSDEL